MSFIERQIVITVTLQQRQGVPSKSVAPNPNPTFQGTTSNTIKLVGGGPAAQNGLRISAKITRPGALELSGAEVQIYNLPLSLINQLGTLGVPYPFEVGGNHISIEAGDASNTPTLIFNGFINNAWADFTGMPDSIFNISAKAFSLYGAAPTQAVGYAGGQQVATLLENLASQCTLANPQGLSFVNEFPGGKTPILSNPYLSGSIRDQIFSLAQAAGINAYIDDVKGALVIWPKTGSLTAAGAQVPIIAPPPKGNMIGYPSYTQVGVNARIEFSADFAFGTMVQVQSSLIQANNNWIIHYMEHDLECQSPDGPWFTSLEMHAPGFNVIPQKS